MKTQFNPAEYDNPKIFIGDIVFIKHSKRKGIVSNIGTHPKTNEVNSYSVSYSNGSCYTYPENLELICKL